jgi:hypothetical protein
MCDELCEWGNYTWTQVTLTLVTTASHSAAAAAAAPPPPPPLLVPGNSWSNAQTVSRTERYLPDTLMGSKWIFYVLVLGLVNLVLAKLALIWQKGCSCWWPFLCVRSSFIPYRFSLHSQWYCWQRTETKHYRNARLNITQNIICTIIWFKSTCEKTKDDYIHLSI